jgi:hypothetical protein
MAAVILASVLLLREGVICILMLAPLWLLAGWAGAGAAFYLRQRVGRGRTYCTALLALPFIAMQVEPMLPVPSATRIVTRSIVIDAPAARIWPLLQGIPDVRAGEGRWNLSQDLVGVPRPRGARLVGEGLGAERLASWERAIHFKERITEWEPERRIGWRFVFDRIEGWEFTDRHLMPDSPYVRIDSGGYRLIPLGPNRSRIELHKRYWMRTPVNTY